MELQKDKGAMGRVGVDLKVVLFSSEKFELHSSDGTKSFQIVLNEAYRFTEEDDLELLTRAAPKKQIEGQN